MISHESRAPGCIEACPVLKRVQAFSSPDNTNEFVRNGTKRLGEFLAAFNCPVEFFRLLQKSKGHLQKVKVEGLSGCIGITNLDSKLSRSISPVASLYFRRIERPVSSALMASKGNGKHPFSIFACTPALTQSASSLQTGMADASVWKQRAAAGRRAESPRRRHQNQRPCCTSG